MYSVMKSKDRNYSSPKKVSFEQYQTPNRTVYLESARRSVSGSGSRARPRRNRIFDLKTKSKLLQSPTISSKVSQMQSKIDQLTTSLFCRQKRQLELEAKIAKALNNKNQQAIELQKQVSDMYEKLRSQDHQIQTLRLEIERADRCSRIIRENRELEWNLQQSEKYYGGGKQSTMESFGVVEGSGVVKNRRKWRDYSEVSQNKFGVSLDNILSPFSLEQNMRK